MTDKDEIRPATGAPQPWQQDVLTQLAFSALQEQRRARRWGIFFKGLLFVYLFLLLVLLWSPAEQGADLATVRHTALIDIDGTIAADTRASADNLIKGLRRAFDADNVAGVVLRINSPGGSPVQAGYVNAEIRRLRSEHPDKPVYAVISDMCASGGYYVAVAANAIYADKASIVGSIGVLMDGFGFTRAMDKLGVDRRLYTAGANKGFLDPFSPVNEQDVQHIQQMLDTIHRQFIGAVKRARGDRLRPNGELFSGLVWTGEKARELGLIDGFASAGEVARKVIGAERLVDYTPRPNYLDQFADRLGVAFANTLGTRLGLPPGGLH